MSASNAWFAATRSPNRSTTGAGRRLVAVPADPADYASGLLRVRSAAVAAGRRAQDVTPALFVSVRVDEDVERGRYGLDAYARAVHGMPLAEPARIQAVVTGSAEQVGERLARFAAAGARHVVVRLGALDLSSQRDQLERVAELIPALKASASAAAPAVGRVQQETVD